MELLKIFNQENVSEQELQSYTTRLAVRGVVIDDNNKIALAYSSKDNYYTLPGGGIEEGETPEVALHRECREEIRRNVEILGELGRIDEVRKMKLMVNSSSGYLARATSEELLAVDSDIEEDEVVWVELAEAKKLIVTPLKGLSIYFSYAQQRDLLYLEEAERLL